MAVSWTAVSSYAPISNIADGTVNTILAAVKAASTAATSSDPALVVTESPNGTTPDTATGAFAAIKASTAASATAANQATQITAEQAIQANTANLAPGPTTATAISGRFTCSTTATALPTSTFTNGFVLRAATANASGADNAVVNLGGSGVTLTTGYPLPPGDKISYNGKSASQVYAICANATDVIDYTGN